MSEGLKDAPRYRALLPSIIGLACARVGILSGAYGSYESSDDGVFTDGAMLIALAVLLLCLVYFWFRTSPLSQKTVERLGKLCVGAEAASLLCLAVLYQAGAAGGTAELLLCAACTLFGSGCMFCWLRSLRGSASITAAVTVFSALAASEVLTYICALVPKPAEYLVALVFVMAQVGCVVFAHRQPLARTIASTTFSEDYFGFSVSVMESRSFLVVNAVGVGLMGFVVGLLRGYPDGLPIPFTMPTRFLYAAMVIVVCAIVVAAVLGRRQQVLTVGAFLFMEGCALCALFAFTLFPENLEYGAVFATALNAFMVGFVWYVTLAFMTAGWRDPFYYACAGWIIWLGSRAVARMVLMGSYQLHADSPFAAVAMAALILISTQVVLGQFARIRQSVAERRIACEYCQKFSVLSLEANGGKSEAVPSAMASSESFSSLIDGLEPERDSLIARIMGLDRPEPRQESQSGSLQDRARQIGERFLLSPREVEVLALYAQGYTQKKVADVLSSSPDTAHAHIKRIYSKTGFHSRQEILDYMEQYTE